ncbi:hypothetical protein DM02DRAFT_164178 [Periconia macrospinosa]|uniref:Oxidoreductase acuF-like C2H2 type zinc-finger domain-containing protein n=1 Tax=Periconia macrospinosa TaxID=97972 RepID=A0A2V1DB02_9PLEO|nr:hypothetical protein DM02DRAFT_164178 [Periconia macrospinosa]
MSLVQEIKKTDDESEMSESSVTSNNSTNDTLQQCANDLYEYVQLLNELHPSIEAFLPLAEEHAVIPEEHESELTAPMMFSNLIRSKYDQAPMALISSLGQLNFERYNRMAEAREKNLADVDEQPATQEELEEKSTIFHDSGLGSSLPSSAARTNNAPSPAAPSVAARPVAPRSIAPSSITASSLAFTVAGKTRYRLPRLPKDAATMLFSCNFCAKKVSFTNERAWQQHLLQDLLPYSCLEPGCTKINEVFATRKLWIRHLEREHGVNAQSPPRLCLLCQNYTGSGRVQICRHYADHLEDIAIAASPLEVADEEESDDDSNKSDVLTGKKRSALGVIEEGIEEEEVGKQPNKYSSLPVNDGIFPSCAICSREVGTERCPCEDERLKIAVSQAERRHMHLPMENSRNFVLEKTRGQILDHFNQVSARLTSRYQADISATSDPKRNAKTRSAYQLDIDQAWRASVLLYPETLDYYYSLCEIELPEEGSRALQASVIDEYLRKGRFAAGRRE